MKGNFLVLILLITLFVMRDLSAQSITEEKFEKLSLHLGNKDAEKAERVWKSIKSSDVESLSDSLKCMYESTLKSGSVKSLTFIRSLTFCSLEIFCNFEASNNNIRICSKRVQRQNISTCSVLLQD